MSFVVLARVLETLKVYDDDWSETFRVLETLKVYDCGILEAMDIRAQRRQQANDILARLKQAAPLILRAYPVEAAYIYGSVARGTVLPSSDVDVALVLSSALPPYERLKLELAIQAALEDASGFSPVDVRVINEAPLMVRGRIVQEGVLIYEGSRAGRIAFEVATRKRYFDFAPVACRLRDAFLERVRREGLVHG